MKNIRYILSAAAMALLAACAQVNEPEYVKGQPDLEGCYGVYFPAQENTGANELAPEDATELTFTIRREKEDGEIEVPVKVSASENDIFSIDKIMFEDGQAETTFKVTFPKAEIGQTYSCNIVVADPQYASVYGEKETFISFSVVRIKWNLVEGEDGSKTGLYRDDIFSSAYNVAQKFAEHEVEIYERSDKPGYYRISSLYDKDFMSAIFGMSVPEGWFTGKQNIFIDATNPNKVWIPYVELNMLLSPEDGPISICSDVAENEIVNTLSVATKTAYGTLADGVITFPVKGVFIGFGGELAAYGNTSGMLRIVFPGAKQMDYSVAVSAGTASEGVLPVDFALGADIAKVKYAVYEGRLSASDAASHVDAIADDAEASYVDESKTVDLTLDATGIYTLVTANLDAEGTVQGSETVSFGYVAAGEEVPVLVNAGLIVSDKYAPQGYTSENSAEFYIYGQDLNKVYYGLYKSSDVASQAQAVVSDLLKNGLASADELAEINGNGLTDIFPGLNSGTAYTLLVYAFNDYDSKLIQAEVTTAGKVNPIQMNYTMDDLYLGKSKESFYGTYAYYAKEGENTARELIGSVTVSDGGAETTEEGDISLINIKGLFGPLVEAGYIKDDTVAWEAYSTTNGCIIYSLGNIFGKVPFNGATYYGAQMTIMANGAGGLVDNGFVAGITEDGNIAIVDSGLYESYGGAKSLGFYLYDSEEYKSGIGNLLIMSDMLLVDPENLPSSSDAAISSDIQKVNIQLRKAKFNCVESIRTQVRRQIAEALSCKELGIYTGAGVDARHISSAVEFTAVPSGTKACTNGSGAVARNVSNLLK
ncbi:MAG: hypothetical protein NC115_06290 [Bacteroidales bacterium]|nr:hypothetical protein [Bacteroidales bacterium]